MRVSYGGLDKRRIHSAVDDLAPAVFYRASLNGTAKQLTV